MSVRKVVVHHRFEGEFPQRSIQLAGPEEVFIEENLDLEDRVAVRGDSIGIRLWTQVLGSGTDEETEIDREKKPEALNHAVILGCDCRLARKVAEGELP
jgi:hypothetical protein